MLCWTRPGLWALFPWDLCRTLLSWNNAEQLALCLVPGGRRASHSALWSSELSQSQEEASHLSLTLQEQGCRCLVQTGYENSVGLFLNAKMAPLEYLICMFAEAFLHHFSKLEALIATTLKPKIHVLKIFLVKEASKCTTVHTMPLPS